MFVNIVHHSTSWSTRCYIDSTTNEHEASWSIDNQLKITHVEKDCHILLFPRVSASVSIQSINRSSKIANAHSIDIQTRHNEPRLPCLSQGHRKPRRKRAKVLMFQRQSFDSADRSIDQINRSNRSSLSCVSVDRLPIGYARC